MAAGDGYPPDASSLAEPPGAAADCKDSFDFDAMGRSAAELMVPGTNWINRRVQSIRYSDTEPSLKCVRASVDFIVPAGHQFVPVSVAPKWPPAFDFDFFDGDGNSVPRISAAENGAADLALLTEIARRVDPELVVREEIIEPLETIAMGYESDLAAALNRFLNALPEPVWKAAEDSAGVENRLIELVELLADNTLLWLPVNAKQVGRRMICKFEYLIKDEESSSSVDGFLRALAWRPTLNYFALHHIGSDASFHLNLEVPQYLTIRDARPKYLRSVDGGDPSDVEAPPPPVGRFEDEFERANDDAERAGMRPSQHREIAGRNAHVYVTGRRPLIVDLEWVMAPRRYGFVIASFIATLVIALLTVAFCFWREPIRGDEAIDGAVGVLALVPALITYLVIRSADHPVTRRHLIGVQSFVIFAALIPVAMAVLLLAYHSNPDALETAWKICAGLSFVPMVVTGISLKSCGARAISLSDGHDGERPHG